MKGVKYLYYENYKTLLKEIEEDTIIWKHIHAHRLKKNKQKYCKKAILLNLTYRFNSISIKIATAFFTELEQIILKFVCNHKKKYQKQS